MKIRFFVIPLLGVAVLLSLGLIAGLGNGSIGAAAELGGGAPTAPYAALTGGVDAPTESVAEYIGWDKAKEIVFAALGVSETEIYDVDYDFERGRYEIDFDYGGCEYEYEVDAMTGELVKNRVEPDDDYRIPVESTPAESAPVESAPVESVAEYIGWDKAKEIVFAALGVSETEIYDVDYDFERGRYEIDFDYGGYEYEYEVDAVTGELVKNRVEPDDDYRIPVESAPVESAPVESVAEYIGWDKAKEIVFAALGVSETEIYDVDYDFERGRYEIDFDHGGYEYEYEVDAVTGELVRAHKEWDD